MMIGACCRTAVVVIAGVVVVAGCSSDDSGKKFLQALHQAGVPTQTPLTGPPSQGAGVKTGRFVCANLDHGLTLADTINTVAAQELTGSKRTQHYFSIAQADIIVRAAVEFLCPQHAYLLQPPDTWTLG